MTFGKTLSYGYDANGNRASLTEGSTTFGYFYDSQNRLKRADAFGGSLNFEYDAAGRRTSLSRPNGIRTAYEYDDASQILSLVHSKGPQVVLGFAYGYDAHGMRTSKTRETGYREAYGYDAADRLVRVDYGTSKRAEYGLDNLGNRVLEDTTTSPPSGLVRNSGTFNAFNQLVSSGGPGTTFPATTNAWDLNGNLLTETKTPSGLPPEVTTYGWDKDNRLRSMTPPSGSPTNYRYLPNGLRTERDDAAGVVRFLMDQAAVLDELDATSAATAEYFTNPQVIDEPLAYRRSTATEYPLADALGSVYAATDAMGTVVHQYDFDVFGKRTDLGGSAPAIDLGFTGRRHDLNGLVENWNRQRRPELGGWLQPDRLGMVDGPNLYAYVRNLPTMRFDSTGQVSSVQTLAVTNLVAFLWLMVDIGAVTLRILPLIEELERARMACPAVAAQSADDADDEPEVEFQDPGQHNRCWQEAAAIARSRGFGSKHEAIEVACDFLEECLGERPQKCVDGSIHTPPFGP